jgi:bifunctional UDP-N-acetylglucosamine pyrophosphorylase/glucosamine-1-phosphate N-acetyltransferase
MSSLLTVITTHPETVAGFGRIVRNKTGEVVGIVEDGDASEDQKAIQEVNAGIYMVEATLLFSLLDRINSDNVQGEFYLTDVLMEATKDSVPINSFELRDPQEAIGVNTRSDLAQVAEIFWNKIREDLMESGVTLLDPASLYIDHKVRIGYDTVIHPSVTISGATEIGRDCVIESGVYITDSIIGDGVHVKLGSRLDHAVVQDGASVGPMAHLRPEAIIGKQARIGNFVEIKKTSVGDGSKAAHLTYLGDSDIGNDVNIGCGTITCNYDGKKKHRTTIKDKCFVGSDVQFVAPVEVGEASVIGAGSTITRDVPPNSLAVSRAKQKIYPLRGSTEPKSSDEDRKS